MDAITFDYSTKNIPIPSKEKYKFELIKSTEKIIKNMRWKAHFFDDPNSRANNRDENSNGPPDCSAFKSKRCPPTIPDMKNFEKDLANMIDNLKFKSASSPFQTKLKEDLQRIKECDKLIIPADKT